MLKYKVTPESSSSVASSLFSSPVDANSAQYANKNAASDGITEQQTGFHSSLKNITSQQDENYSNFITPNPVKTKTATIKKTNKPPKSTSFAVDNTTFSKSSKRAEMAVIKFKREPGNRNSVHGVGSGDDYNLHAAKNYHSNSNLADLSRHDPSCKKYRRQCIKRKMNQSKLITKFTVFINTSIFCINHSTCS